MEHYINYILQLSKFLVKLIFKKLHKEKNFKNLKGVKATTKKNKTKDWALVQNAASAGGVKVELGLFR